MIAQFIARELEAGLKSALRPLAQYVRMLLIGSALYVLSTVGYLFALGFGSVALYFVLLDIPSHASAAGIVGLAWLAIAILLTVVGLHRLRPPR